MARSSGRDPGQYEQSFKNEKSGSFFWRFCLRAPDEIEFFVRNLLHGPEEQITLIIIFGRGSVGPPKKKQQYLLFETWQSLSYFSSPSHHNFNIAWDLLLFVTWTGPRGVFSIADCKIDMRLLRIYDRNWQQNRIAPTSFSNIRLTSTESNRRIVPMYVWSSVYKPSL